MINYPALPSGRDIIFRDCIYIAFCVGVVVLWQIIFNLRILQLG